MACETARGPKQLSRPGSRRRPLTRSPNPCWQVGTAPCPAHHHLMYRQEVAAQHKSRTGSPLVRSRPKRRPPVLSSSLFGQLLELGEQLLIDLGHEDEGIGFWPLLTKDLPNAGQEASAHAPLSEGTGEGIHPLASSINESARISHKFDLAGRLVEPRFERSAEREESDPTFARDRLGPVRFHAQQEARGGRGRWCHRISHDVACLGSRIADRYEGGLSVPSQARHFLRHTTKLRPCPNGVS